MTDKKISELPSITGANLSGTDLIPIVDTSANTTSKVTRTEFFKNVPSITVSGTAQIDRPADHWSTGDYYDVAGTGGLWTQGSFGIDLVSNGYRNSSGTWTGFSAGGSTGAAQISLRPTGAIFFGTDATKADGSSNTPTIRMTLNDTGLGIGTTSPSAPLDVIGDAEINGHTVGRGGGGIGTNVVLGLSTLASNTTGNSNTVAGYLALTANTTGSSNVAVGREALEANTTGTNNVAVGLRALEANTTGTSNVAVGHSALAVHTVDATSAFGHFALTSNTTGTNNSAFGYTALRYNTTGAANTAIGREALTANTTGGNNTAVGLQALTTNTTGVSNSAFGYQALMSNTTGVNNAAVGFQALLSNTTAGGNTAVGLQTLRLNTTGGNNTALGQNAGDVLTTGSRNALVGFGCDPSALDGNDQVVIGYSLVGKGNDTAFIGGLNGAYNEKNVTTWETTSDERIKKNIVDNNEGLSVLSQIQVRNFEYRTPEEITDLPSHAAIKKDGVQLGVIAQELQHVLPECVSENSTGVLSVNTDPLVWYLINAVKELKAEIEQLKGK